MELSADDVAAVISEALDEAEADGHELGREEDDDEDDGD